MKSMLKILFLGLALGLFVKFFVLEAFTVPTASMSPTIVEGQVVWLYKWPWVSFDRGDVVAFENQGVAYVKRITAVPGDSLALLSTPNGTQFARRALLRGLENVKTWVVLPQKGQTIALNALNYDFYAPLLRDTEGGAVAKVADQVFIGAQSAHTFTFKNDYLQRYHKHTRKRPPAMDDLDATQTHSRNAGYRKIFFGKNGSGFN